jgi:hypothetical protein
MSRGTALLLLAGWSLALASALFGFLRTGGRLESIIMVAAGCAWLLAEWDNPAASSAVFSTGLALSAATPAVLTHLALAYPSGRLRNGLVWSMAAFGLVVLRLMLASPAKRRAVAWVVVPALCYLSVVIAEHSRSVGRGYLGADSADARLWRLQALALVGVSIGAVAGLVRDRIAHPSRRCDSPTPSWPWCSIARVGGDDRLPPDRRMQPGRTESRAREAGRRITHRRGAGRRASRRPARDRRPRGNPVGLTRSRRR